MKDKLIQSEVEQILTSKKSTEDKQKSLMTLIEQVKIAFYADGANDVSRFKFKKRQEEKRLVQSSVHNNVVSLNFNR